MPLWIPPEVTEQPKVDLEKWLIFRVFYDKNTYTDHVVGFAEGEGRVSTKIVEHDPDSNSVTTRSGRVYVIDPDKMGANSDALYVWEQWKGINKFKQEMNISVDYVMTKVEKSKEKPKPRKKTRKAEPDA